MGPFPFVANAQPALTSWHLTAMPHTGDPEPTTIGIDRLEILDHREHDASL